MELITIDQLKEAASNKANRLKWILGIGGVLVLAPFIWVAVYAMLGAAALGLATGLAIIVGLAVVNFAPVIAMKFKNAKINAIIREAQENPIPTLWAGHEADMHEADEMAQAVEDYETEIENVKGKMRQLQRNLTPDDLAEFNGNVKLLEDDLDLQQRDLSDFRTKLDEQEIEIKRAEAIWNLNMAVDKAGKKNPNRAAEVMASIKRTTALDAVQSSMNRSKAQVRARIRSRRSLETVGGRTPEAPALVHDPVSTAIDASFIELGANTRVGVR